MVFESNTPLVPCQRLAIFVDGWNFKYATYDAFGMQVDFKKLLDYFSHGSILLRAYYYTGEWDDEAIEHYINLTDPPDPQGKKEELISQRDGFQIPLFLY